MRERYFVFVYFGSVAKQRNRQKVFTLLSAMLKHQSTFFLNIGSGILSLYYEYKYQYSNRDYSLVDVNVDLYQFTKGLLIYLLFALNSIS